VDLAIATDASPAEEVNAANAALATLRTQWANAFDARLFTFVVDAPPNLLQRLREQSGGQDQ
jgi:hypothetical protein